LGFHCHSFLKHAAQNVLFCYLLFYLPNESVALEAKVPGSSRKFRSKEVGTNQDVKSFLLLSNERFTLLSAELNDKTAYETYLKKLMLLPQRQGIRESMRTLFQIIVFKRNF
jgi:hypothetical protein